MFLPVRVPALCWEWASQGGSTVRWSYPQYCGTVRPAPVEQLLKKLGDSLNFTVDFWPLANPSAVVNGKFEGSLDDILSEILRSSSYVAQRSPLGVITHVVVIPAAGGEASGTPASVGNTPVAVDVKSPQASPVTARADQAASQSSLGQLNGRKGSRDWSSLAFPR
jgi:hypothetical protein